jgi:hypothetical protein
LLLFSCAEQQYLGRSSRKYSKCAASRLAKSAADQSVRTSRGNTTSGCR